MRAHHQHTNRQDLGKEFPYNDQIQIVLFILFVVAILLDIFLFRISAPVKGLIPLYIRLPIAIIVVGIGSYFVKNGLDVVFGEKREKMSVISHGVFSLVRHPIYFGAIVLYLGFVLLSLSILGFCVWIVIIIFYIISSRYEERYMLVTLGEEYRDYMNRVPMLFPLFHRRRR